MQTIKIFCEKGHKLCELRVVGESVLVNDVDDERGCSITCFPYDREVHLGRCRRCEDERDLQKLFG